MHEEIRLIFSLKRGPKEKKHVEITKVEKMNKEREHE